MPTISRLRIRDPEWNPGRSIPELWQQAIERHQRLQDHAGGPQKSVELHLSVQLMLDFPELIELIKEDPRAFYLMQIELGNITPDWNVAIFPDGRSFRTKVNHAYEFNFTELMDVKTGRKEVKSYRLPPQLHFDGEIEDIFTDLDKTTDAELERLSGWNYNINPYTTRGAWSPVAWSNPLMPDEIPEPLKMPPDWVNWDYMALIEEEELERYAELENRLRTVVSSRLQHKVSSCTNCGNHYWTCIDGATGNHETTLTCRCPGVASRLQSVPMALAEVIGGQHLLERQRHTFMNTFICVSVEQNGSELSRIT